MERGRIVVEDNTLVGPIVGTIVDIFVVSTVGVVGNLSVGTNVWLEYGDLTKDKILSSLPCADYGGG